MKPLSKLNAERLPLDALADYLHLSTDHTGAYRQNSVLEMSLRSAILHCESALLAVFFRLEFAFSAASHFVKIGPNAEWAQPKILRAYSRSLPDLNRVDDWKLVENCGEYFAQYQGSSRFEEGQIHVELGFGEWADIPADIQIMLFQFARYFYDERGGHQNPAMPQIPQALLQKYRPLRIGFSHEE